MLVLAAVMVVPLLLVAGPALAVSPFEGNPPGKQLDGKHDINGRLIETNRLYGPIDDDGNLILDDDGNLVDDYIERVFYDVRSSDPRLSGKMILDVTYAYPNENLNVVFGGEWRMFAGSGVPQWEDPTIWTDHFEGHESANYVFGKPFQLSVSG